jgi:hypothetical protein
VAPAQARLRRIVVGDLAIWPAAAEGQGANDSANDQSGADDIEHQRGENDVHGQLAISTAFISRMTVTRI